MTMPDNHRQSFLGGWSKTLKQTASRALNYLRPLHLLVYKHKHHNKKSNYDFPPAERGREREKEEPYVIAARPVAQYTTGRHKNAAVMDPA